MYSQDENDEADHQPKVCFFACHSPSLCPLYRQISNKVKEMPPKHYKSTCIAQKSSHFRRSPGELVMLKCTKPEFPLECVQLRLSWEATNGCNFCKFPENTFGA